MFLVLASGLLVVLLAAVFPRVLPGEPIASKLTPADAIVIDGVMLGPTDVSGIAFAGSFVLLVSDESARVEVLRRDGDGITAVGHIVLDPEGDELDLEAISADGDRVYVVGSHARVRPKLKKADTYDDVRKKMTKIARGRDRDVLFRFRLTADGTATDIEQSSLRPAIERSKLLAPFADLPGKENGVDVEGLVARDGRLFVGFRGPVLRDNYVPVLSIKFGKSKGDVLFLNLGGRGVLSMSGVSDGFLILAGPVGDGPGSFQLYHWNGHDCLPGADPQGVCDLRGEFATDPEHKPEGIALLREDAEGYEFVLVSDGARNGNPTGYRLAK